MSSKFNGENTNFKILPLKVSLETIANISFSHESCNIQLQNFSEAKVTSVKFCKRFI